MNNNRNILRTIDSDIDISSKNVSDCYFAILTLNYFVLCTYLRVRLQSKIIN
jgi:hypothetical protein